MSCQNRMAVSEAGPVAALSWTFGMSSAFIARVSPKLSDAGMLFANSVK